MNELLTYEPQGISVERWSHCSWTLAFLSRSPADFAFFYEPEIFAKYRHVTSIVSPTKPWPWLAANQAEKNAKLRARQNGQFKF